MKKLLICVLALGLFAGCGINRQVQLMKNFENCRFEITGADSVYLAHQNITNIVNRGELDMSKLPGLALGYLRKDIPLEARINLRIDNPSLETAAVNQFEYRLLIKDQEIANGFVNRRVEVPGGGGSTVVPVALNSNVYAFLSNGKTMSEIGDFLNGGKSGGTERKSVVTIKFRPSFVSDNGKVTRLGWFTVDKELSSKILF